MIVQDLFRDCDIKALGDALFKDFSECEKAHILKNIENFNFFYQKIKETVDDMLSLTPILTEDYIYVTKYVDIDDKDSYWTPTIVYKKEILENEELIRKLAENFDVKIHKENFEKITSYGLSFIPRNELLGYKFCENVLKENDKYEIIASVFHELTFFGYSNEANEQRIEEETKAMDEAVKEIDEGNYVDFETAMKELFGEDYELPEYIPPTEEELNENIIINQAPIYKEFLWILEKEKADA